MQLMMQTMKVIFGLMVVWFSGQTARAMDKSQDPIPLEQKVDQAWTITQYVDPQSESPKVIINAGTINGLYRGVNLQVYRQLRYQKIPTGSLKIEEVKDRYAIASVVEEGSDMSQAMFPKFPGVMAGDRIERTDVRLAKRRIITPELSMKYSELFHDPKSTPFSYELTEQGKQMLKDKMQQFLTARIPKIMIEGHTDHNGPSHENQIESYQRALTIRQFLVEELEFDADRLVAVGFGESEPVDQSYAAGYQDHNRRIVIKSVGIQNM